jgi:hypothetical protein
MLDELFDSIPPDARLNELSHLASGAWRAQLIQDFGMTQPAYGKSAPEALSTALNYLRDGVLIDFSRPSFDHKPSIISVLGLSKPINRRI